MLQTVDVLIGFSVVMLVLSAIVTMLIQLVVTTVYNLKGRVLREGVAHLLRLLDKNGLTNKEAFAIADAVLRNTLVARPAIVRSTQRLAGSIHREDLIKLILDFAAEADLTKADALAKGAAVDETNPPDLRTRLAASLKRNGLSDPPDVVLRAVRATALELERSHPALANDVRGNMALLEHASSEFLGKMNAWFDQSIDRTVAIFTERTRLWTVGFSLLVAMFFQVNTFDLLKRLSVDHDATATLVAAAVANPQTFAPKTIVNPAVLSEAASPDKPQVVTAAGEALKNIRDDDNLKQLVDTNLIKWPDSFPNWWSYWWHPGTFYVLLLRMFGILLTVGLLSLGAPVWYELLKNLIQLRSLAARKDDDQRTLRQTNQ